MPVKPHTLAWYLVGALVAIMVGWFAARLHLVGLSPIGLLPLGLGLALGGILGGLAAMTRVTSRRHLLIGAALLSILAVLAEHAWLYHEFRRQWHESRAQSPQMAMFRPETPLSPAEYVANEASFGRVVLWCVDAALVTAATVGTVAIARRSLK
jgi:hypothetical protein